MSADRPNHWSASVELISGEYQCRFYCGDERSVVYCGPASITYTKDADINGSADLIAAALA
jgi:hypothetical protein